MAELAVDLAYDGPALEQHEMDVRDLAPALLSAAELFQATNAVLHPADPPVSVNVRAMSEGSFLVQLKLVYDAARDALVSPEAEAGVNLVAILTVLGTAVRLIRKRAQSPQVSEEPSSDEPGMVRITFADETTLEVPVGTTLLCDDALVRRKLAETVDPLEREGIDVVRLSHGDETVAEVLESERLVFQSSLPPVREVLQENERDTYLTILSPTFQEGTKWRLSEGGAHFYATLSDPEFQAKVNDGERFSKMDVLKATIRTTQWKDDSGLHQDVEVIKVLEHDVRHPPQQISLRLDDPPSADP